MCKDKAVSVLQDIIQINTENNHEELVARYFQTLLTSHGIPSNLIHYKEGRASLVTEIQNGEGKTLVLSGHMDVVSAGNVDEWKYPPFSGYIDDENVIWGRGSSDMKSGLAALVMAFIALHESKNFKGTIKLLATVGEEVGEHGSKQLTDLGYMDNVDALLIGEPCNIGIIYAHKGSFNYKVISKGIAAHSSMPELGNNAIEHLSIAMNRISEHFASKAKDLANAVLGTTFHNITLIHGGLQVNSIPDYAEFEANVRTVPEFDNNAVLSDITKIIDELNKQEGFELELVVTADQLPVQTDSDSSLIKSILEVVNDMPTLKVPEQIELMGTVLHTDLKIEFEKMGFSNELKPIVASGTTDAAQFIRANKNLELAVYGPGIPMLNHKVNERISISQYLDFIEAYKRIISRYLSGHSR